MNRELMLRVADAIEAHPEKFKMSHWLRHDSRGCATGGCIAGTTVLLAGTPNDLNYVEAAAMRLLDLNDEETIDLFYIDQWPEDLLNAVGNKEMTEAQGAVTLLRRMATAEEAAS